MKTRARNMHLSLSAAINPDTMEPYKTHTNSHFYQVPNRSPVCDTLCHMQFVRVLIVVVLLLLSQIDGVGHKQRQQLNKRLASELADDLSDRCSDAASKKLKGGHKQRSRSAAASSSSAATAQNVDLPFSRNLIKDWAAGRITCEQVQRYALTAEQQGANGVGELASMGAGGKHQSNIFRAMRNFLGIPAGAPGITFFEIPTTQGTRTPHPFLLPHEFFSSFFSGRSALDWEMHVTGPKGACSQFWDSIKDTEFVKRHPDLPKKTWKHTVPLGFHADAGAFSKQDSVYVFSFNSLVGRGTTHQKRFVFTVIKKSLMLDNTMDEILCLFAWSCNTLLTGQTPSLGLRGNELSSGGKPLAGPWRAALCQVRGDWAFFKECFNFPQWNGAVRMCFVVGHLPLSDIWLGLTFQMALAGGQLYGRMSLTWITLSPKAYQYQCCSSWLQVCDSNP